MPSHQIAGQPKDNVAILINSLGSGGAERVVSNLLNYWSTKELGFKIHLLVMEDDFFFKLEENPNIAEVVVLSGSFWERVRKLQQLVKGQRISLVQSHLFRANFLNIFTKVFFSRHKAQIVNTVSPSSKYRDFSLKSFLAKLAIWASYKKSDALIYKSKAMQLDIENNFRCRRKESHLIYNPVDCQKLAEAAADQVTDFSFESGIRYICYTGRFHEDKRQEDLVSALAKLRDGFADLQPEPHGHLKHELQIVFIGDGPRRAYVENFASQLSLSSKIHFLGRKKNPYKYMAKCHYYVSCSVSEGFPNTILEAMCLGLPVVAADCLSGPRELMFPESNHPLPQESMTDIEIGENGILVEKQNIEQIAKAIALIHSDEEKRQAMARNAELMVRNLFTPEKSFLHYEQAIANLL